ncbi:hypothetical protein [Actinomadura terrae]|uniref:hypothetical protein n=1 Tax=Actinomadura terrae TaxID=604353 RepID=UPI001FA6AF7F|nr:hypothetical protein [Actinomadura terrae]
MLAWVIVLVLLVFAHSLQGLAVKTERAVLRRVWALLAVASVAVALVYAVDRHSLWMAAVSILAAIPLVIWRPHAITPEALAAKIRAYIRSDRVLLLTVGEHGGPLISHVRGIPRSSKRYRFVDECPHCFLEEQVSALFEDTVAEGVIDHYRANLADNRPVELQFTRSWDPPAGTPVVNAPGEPWVLNYYYLSNLTWQVPFPVACDVHSSTMLHRPPSSPGVSG